MGGGFPEDATGDIQPVLARPQRHRRFMTKLLGEHRHCLGIDIGRIGEDEIVFCFSNGREEIAPEQVNPRFQPVIPDVFRRERGRLRREFNSVYNGIREGMRGEDRETAAARAEIEHAGDALGIVDQSLRPAGAIEQRREQEIRNVGARHNGAGVRAEGKAVEIGSTGEIGRRNALFDAQRQPFAQHRLLAQREPGVGESVEVVDREIEAFEDEKRSLIQRRSRAVAVVQPGGVIGGNGIPQHIAER